MNARIITVCLIHLAAAVITEACQVPVFRYALERWQPDHYQLVIVHDGNLTDEEQANLTYLEENRVGPNGPIINLHFEALDLAKEEKQFARWKKLHSEQNASVSIHLFFPFEAFEQDTNPIWNGNLTRNNINQILDSPARRELVKRILSGDSAVWLFLESGNSKEDEAIFETLQKYVKIAREEISVPKGVIQKSALDDPNLLLSPGDEENILESSVPLKIAFSILRLSRKDPQEVILRSMLLRLEDDLLDKEMEDKPMLFPAFGKGRVLPPLIGAGISEENALADCGYLCGACSCQVKNQNPGMDILVKADWWTALEGSSVIAEKELPPLTGVEDLIAANEPAKDNAEENSTTLDANTPSSEILKQKTTKDEPLVPNGLIIGVVLISGILLVGTFALSKNRER